MGDLEIKNINKGGQGWVTRPVDLFQKGHIRDIKELDHVYKYLLQHRKSVIKHILFLKPGRDVLDS